MVTEEPTCVWIWGYFIATDRWSKVIIISLFSAHRTESSNFLPADLPYFIIYLVTWFIGLVLDQMACISEKSIQSCKPSPFGSRVWHSNWKWKIETLTCSEGRIREMEKAQKQRSPLFPTNQLCYTKKTSAFCAFVFSHPWSVGRFPLRDFSWLGSLLYA